MKSIQINIEDMKKKIEIEDKLLFDINNNLQEYISNFKYIRNNFTQIESEFNTLLNINNIDIITELETKLFEYPNTIYSIFQHFYSNRKNYIGMNLTGLVQGKIETGLGFRSNIIKQNFNDIKDTRIKSYIIKKFDKFTSDTIIYKIKSSGFEWNKFGSTSTQCDFYYIIVNMNINKYFICV